jgi:hypothetical protein
LDLRNNAHVSEQFLCPAKIFSHRRKQRQSPLHIAVNICLSVLNVIRIDQHSIDPIAEDRFGIKRIGLDSETRVWFIEISRRCYNLLRLDESNLQNPFARGEESAKDFAIPISSPHDFSLAASPVVFVAKSIQNILDSQSEISVIGIFGNGLIAMPLSDDVIDSVFEGVDCEFIGVGEQSTL